jgi:tetratricopeptide (TPR) repeat protein
MAKKTLRAAEEARALAAAGRYLEAASAFERVGEAARRLGRDSEAVQAWSLGADAARRGDAPRVGLALLEKARALNGGEGEGKLVVISLAAALVDLGRLSEGEVLLEGLDAGQLDRGLAALQADLLIGIHLSKGAVDRAEGLLLGFGDLLPAGAEPMRWFREAQVLRLRGDLSGARRGLMRVIEEAPRGPAWDGPRAAAWGDLGELELLLGEVEAGIAAFEQAGALWRSTARASGATRIRASILRAALMRGHRLAVGELPGVREELARAGLVLAAAEIDWALGLVLGDLSRLDQAVAVAQTAGASLLEGRLRLARWSLGADRVDEAHVRALLVGDRPWSRRISEGWSA